MRNPLLWLLTLTTAALAGEYPREMTCYRGTTPTIDGVLAPGEWDDAVTFTGVEGWTPQFSPTTDPNDLSLRGWVKHDGQDLYFAFLIHDDVLYGIDTPRWLPKRNPHAHELSRRGFPWFGDEMELLLNPSYEWREKDGENAHGDGSSSQMVCNLTKSRLGGVGEGGLLEGEPRSRKLSWDNYQAWILSGAMQAVARVQPEGKPSFRQLSRTVKVTPNHRGGDYVIEWRVQADPCLEVWPGIFWSPRLGTVRMGLNIALGDIDWPDSGAKQDYTWFNHEDWWAGEKGKRTWLKQYGTLIVEPGEKP